MPQLKPMKTINFWDQYPFMQGFNELPPWLIEPNTTDWWQVAFIYMLCVALDAHNIVEIGVDQGYGAWTFGNAAKKNGGKYLGVDIEDVWNKKIEPCQSTMFDYFCSKNLPVNFFKANTKEIKSIPIERIDIAFVDGEHSRDAVLNEVYNLILPKCQPGWSYIFLHDIVDFPGVAEAWNFFKTDERFEAIGFYPNYGLGLLRVIKL